MMKQQWQSMSEREKNMVSIGSIAIILGILYFFIWSPVSDKISQTKQVVSYQQETLQWMQTANQAIQQLRQSSTRPQQVSDESFLSVTAQTLANTQLSEFTSQVRETQNNKVRVSFANVPFDKLMDWLKLIWNRYNISVNQIALTPKNTGFVEVNLVLQKS